jgi:hypothetical protein
MTAPITVVSGVPRSGTSLAMQMLHAGGMEILSDAARVADPDNPRGYFELERVKQLRNDKAWLEAAGGKAVKVIHLLLMELPADRPYNVIFLRRELSEVVRSQAAMLARNARQGAQLPPERLAAIYQQQLTTVDAWLAARPNFRVLQVQHAELINDGAGQARRINHFLGGMLDESRMGQAVDPALHRNRS